MILLVFVLPVLIGMTGLTIDAGTLLAAHRRAQNIADAAALAGADELLAAKLRGEGFGTARESALRAVREYVVANGLTADDYDPQIPPEPEVPPLGDSFYDGKEQYVKVRVRAPARTFFLPILGLLNAKGEPIQTAAARAVAGYEHQDIPQLITLLDFLADPGLSVQGTQLTVPGGIGVNSQRGEFLVDGRRVNLGYPNSPAIDILEAGYNKTGIKAADVRVVGGVRENQVGKFSNVVEGGPNPLRTGQPPVPDPLGNLPVPTKDTGVDTGFWTPKKNGTTWSWIPASNARNVAVQFVPDASFIRSANPDWAYVNLAKGETVDPLPPGIYSSITIKGENSFQFQGGIYVLKGANAQGNSLEVDLNGTLDTVGQKGLMFYNTSSDYEPINGTPDRYDLERPTFNGGNISFAAKSANLRGLDASQSGSNPFQGILFYQRRANGASIEIRDSVSDRTASNLHLYGTIYGKNAKLVVKGDGDFHFQVIAGSMAVIVTDLNKTTTFQSLTDTYPLNKVYLVE
jgi:hypothetical protein